MNMTNIRITAVALAVAGAVGAVAVATAQPGPGMERGMMGGGMGRGMGMGGMNTVQVPADNPITAEKVELGKQLYFDPRLSKDGTVSCNSCHDLAVGGADPKPVSTGVGGAQGTRNSPTVWNSAFHNAQFWDGRAPSLEEQAKGPLINPAEMAMPNYEAVVAVVKGIPGYARQFDQVFGNNSVTIDNIAKAIATYERTLISRNSKFDNFRFADKGALTQEEWNGFRTFRMAGCMECHMGPDFSGPPPLARGDGFYQKFPRFQNSPMVAQYQLLDDGGRYNVTKQESDRHVYRVPTLRNVAATAPYFHNGKVPTLADAAKVCAKGGSNRDLSAAEVKSLVAFMEVLTGEMPAQKPPKLP